MAKKSVSFKTAIRSVLFIFLVCAAIVFSVSIFFSVRSYIVSSDEASIKNEIKLIQKILLNSKDEHASLIQEVKLEPKINHDKFMAYVRYQGNIIYSQGIRQLLGPEYISGDFWSQMQPQRTLLRFSKKDHQFYRVHGVESKQAKYHSLVIVAYNVTDEVKYLKNFLFFLTLLTSGFILISYLIADIISRVLTQPMKQLIEKMHAVSFEEERKPLHIESRYEEIHHLSQAFNLMFIRLEKSYNNIKQFSSDVSHEMRTPLHNMLLYAEKIRDSSHEASQKAAEEIIAQCRHLSKVINQLLFINHAESTCVQLSIQEVNICTLIEKTCEYFSMLAEEKEIKMTLDLPPMILFRLDPDLFQRALSNLLSNAIKYTQENGKIRVYCRHKHHVLKLSVIDNGVGIPQAHLSSIFDRLYRVDTSRNHSTGGFGLGLAIVKSIVTLHQGRTRVLSTPQQGTRFDLIWQAPHQMKA